MTEVAELIGQIKDPKGENAAANPLGSLFRRAKTDFDSNSSQTDVVSEEETRELDEPVDSSIASTRDELHGLMEKVRGLSKQFKS